jgi:hypothetical protein
LVFLFTKGIFLWAAKTDNGKRRIIGCICGAAVKNPGSQFRHGLSLACPTAGQRFCTVHAITGKHKPLPPLQGKLFRFFPSTLYCQTGWRSGLTDSLSPFSGKKIRRRCAPFV